MLVTLVERKTNFEKLFKIASQRANAVNQVFHKFIRQLNGLEEEIFKTITSDNGSEFTNLSELFEAIKAYFVILMLLMSMKQMRINIKLFVIFYLRINLRKKLQTPKSKRILQWMNNYSRRILDFKTKHQAFVQGLKN